MSRLLQPPMTAPAYTRYHPFGESGTTITRILAERIREYRQLRGLTQSELSKELAVIGVRIQQEKISLIERNRRYVQLEELFALAYVLDCPIEWLVLPDEGNLQVGGLSIERRDARSLLVSRA